MLSPLVDERQAPLRTDAKSKGRKINVLSEGSFEGGLWLCGEQQVLRKYGGVTSKPSSGMVKLYVFQRWGDCRCSGEPQGRCLNVLRRV